jgi:predicted nucleic acid-binding protein
MVMMKGMLYLLDTVIIIDHFNGIKKATRWLSDHPNNECAISVITRAEVLTGASNEEIQLLSSFLDQYHCLPLTADVADTGADLRKKNGWKLPDAFQAALALHHHLDLVTRNTKDFNPKKHDFVHLPYHS